MNTLDQYVRGCAFKYLSAVDAKGISNQHEIGSNKLKEILGDPGLGELRFEATFIFFNPELEEPESCVDTVTYYDTRRYQEHRGPELRLYYRSNSITERFEQGDFCLIAKLHTGRLLIATAKNGSDDEYRLRYLFGDSINPSRWIVEPETRPRKIDLAVAQIMDALGIERKEEDDTNLIRATEVFGMKFPPTAQFSALARKMVGEEISVFESPDAILEAWMLQEEKLFRALEKRIVSERLIKGFDDVDDFVAFSLSVQNRRKSRVGHAFENHLEAIFQAYGLKYARGAITEGKSKPDFLFPGIEYYNDPESSSPPLRMLAAKTTCKDRWRQVLAEAKKIPQKHLITLETAISESQTGEMREHQVQLVVPESIAQTYTCSQQSWLQSVRAFVEMIKAAQVSL